MAVKVKKPTRRMMKTVNPEITHHEPNPYDLNEFVERMMVLGYSYNTIVEQCVLKYNAPRHNAEERVKYIRKSWIEYGNLDSEEKKAVLEQQLIFMLLHHLHQQHQRLQYIDGPNQHLLRLYLLMVIVQ